MRPFVLNAAKIGRYHQSPAPAAGEEVGTELRKLAEQHQSWAEMNDGTSDRHHYYLAATFYNLAADAYECASSASIGHKRSARYDEATEAYRKKAEEIGKLLDTKV